MTTTTTSTDFPFPPALLPPFYTLQPVLSTRTSQLTSWSHLIQSYCRHHRLFQLSLRDAADGPLFYNRALGRRLNIKDAREVVEWMASKEGERGRSGLVGVEATGQKNTVLTLYELTESDATASQEFHGMDPELLQRSLQILVKRGKAQIFGSDDSLGVKFF
ncbi:hypothetical protein H2199_001714 [Coniosporium tulheliwenetii]|uniref:Uncharacterized protein n=1 Tax=Coniosporium tulheliwenetii TaxID=3383036 RepID=A0ACC2ZKD1_9PEZI|nr:hypothetical protein H2199_001714 [Cladosporium sp. JES 115]